MHYFVGDTPGAISVGSSSLPLAGFAAAFADLIGPSGTLQFLPATIAGDGVEVTLPVLAEAGVYTLQVNLSSGDTERALSPIRIPVEDPASPWHTIDSARAEWQGAPENDLVLYELLVSAREQVLAFAPIVTGVPVRYRAAQIMQARNTWNGYQRNTNADSYGNGEFTVTVFPLDWHVRQLLRPTTGVPVVG